MKVVDVPIAELKPTEYNPRDCTPQEFNGIKESIARYNFVEPIVVNGCEERKNIVIGGHQRLKVAQALQHTTVPVVYVNIPDMAREKELNLRLNRNVGHWDWDKLFANFEKEMLLDVGFTEEDFAFAENQWDKDDALVARTKAEASNLTYIIKLIVLGEIKEQVITEITEFCKKWGEQVKVD